MGQSTSSLGFSYTVTGITGKYEEFFCRQNVKKRIAKILYLEEPPDDSVNLAYAGSDAISVENCLFIGDRSDRLYPNSKAQEGSELYYRNTSSAGVAHKNILVTQKFAAGAVSQPIPLYFKHILPANIDLYSVKLFDKDFNEISSDNYLVELKQEYDEATGLPKSPPVYTEVHVYNTLESKVDLETGEFEVYYIQYVSSGNATYTKLLDNEPAYREATIDDIWYVTLDLAPWSSAYILNKTGNNYVVNVPPTGQPFSVKYLAQSRIYVEKPVLTDNESLWFPRVSNGSFGWGYGSPTYYTYLYETPEFESQAFNPISPYKMVDHARCVKLTDNLLKLPHAEIQNGGFFVYVSFVIENGGSVLYAITDDTSLVGSRYKDIYSKDVLGSDGEYIVWSNEHLLSIDKRLGVVQVDIQLKDYWDIYATYGYKETFFEVSGLNMNPIFDPNTHKQIRVLYLIPKAIANYNSAATASVYWLKMNPLGLIEETSQNGAGNNTNINYDTELGDVAAYSIKYILGLHNSWKATTYLTTSCTVGSGEIVSVEAADTFPGSGWIRIFDGTYWRYTKYVSRTRTTLTLTDETAELPSSPISITFDALVPKKVELVNFIDEYTVMTARDSAEEAETFGLSYPNLPSCYRQYLVLADMTVNPPHGLQDVNLIDVRENGGGVSPDKYEEAKQLNPEVQWYYDFFKYDGQPHPGNAAIVIKLPYRLLSLYGHEFIEETINNNIPMGIVPLIRYYGYKPEILSITPDTGSIVITWALMGTEFVYDIWYASSPNGPWMKHNKIRILDSGYGVNSYTVDGLDSDKVYYIKITCQDKYDSWWCSYASQDSVGGGYSREDDPPTPPFGNSFGIEYTVI